MEGRKNKTRWRGDGKYSCKILLRKQIKQYKQTDTHTHRKVKKIIGFDKPIEETKKGKWMGKKENKRE